MTEECGKIASHCSENALYPVKWPLLTRSEPPRPGPTLKGLGSGVENANGIYSTDIFCRALEV